MVHVMIFSSDANIIKIAKLIKAINLAKLLKSVE